MIKQGKVWGETSLLFSKNNVEIHRIVGNTGGYSSIHAHEHRYNQFFVETGCMKITEWKKDSNTTDITILGPGESCIVPPGNRHKFEVLEDCVCLEIYWVTMDSSDIVRDSHGGKKSKK